MFCFVKFTAIVTTGLTLKHSKW